MKHLDDGELRRLIDEPEAFHAAAQEHAESCAQCRVRKAELARDAQLHAAYFAGVPAVDAHAAFARVQDRLAPRFALRSWYRTFGALATAAAFVLALLFTPLGGYAKSFLTIFEPQQFQPLEVSSSELRDLRLLPQADDVGTQRVLRKPVRRSAPSVAAARKRIAFRVLAPGALPKGFGAAHYFTLTPGEMTFTFSAKKARAFAKRSGKKLPPMPPGLDGTALQLQTGDVFNAHYEASPQRGAHGSKDRTAFLEIVEAQHPRVTSTGASLQTLERYLLAMPNVTPRLAQQIRALGDIRTTLPVPVAVDKQSSRSVTVQGVRGLAVGDNTGLGAGVLWQKNGVVYAVGGPVSIDEALAVANGLR